ncbi:glutamate-1-semialdehyde 2,1-aminomutase [Streptomyces sp. 2132.2]|uniref:aspartate aminotransferase family protein n=1 Tax=Streptomyces TaxID=1883 RepID=UPI000FB9F1CA|nr:aminotransferase class III-fold pyridoxal phosphate-dependent enzyme [Streptomyces sp. 2132.2]ROQ96957.1 glutamate-1-semialdehyde 2,1-aminomutase [Streptomyces sp. 2132.2]
MITTALDSAYRRYAAKRPISEQRHARARTFLPSGTTRSVLDFDPYPFTVASAAGCRLTDVDGLEYLDYLGDYSVGLAGHNPAAVREALAAVLEKGWSFGAVAAEEAEVARMLCERFESMDLVRFTSSGTEANLVAISLALKAADRSKVLVFDGGYHGGFLSFSRGRPSLNVPFDAVICDYNDLDSVREAFAQWPEQIGCVLLEPMLGSGGRIQADADFLEGIRTLCDENGSVLVFDEVQTSRMSYGGGQALLGVRPDLTTLGKYIGGGLGFGVVGGAEKLMLQIARGGERSYDHSGTFNNNRFSMAASSAMLGTVLTRSSLDALFERGEDLRKRADHVLREHGFQATGWGSLMGFHPTDIPIRRASDLAGLDKRPVELLFHEMLERGVYTGKSGFATLSLPQTPETDDHFLTALEESVRVVAKVGF